MPKLKLTEPPGPTEAELMAHGRRLIGLLGYEAIATGQGRRRVQCSSCHAWHWPSGWQGNDPGCPDLLVTHAKWRAALWVAIEWKRPGARRRPEQIALAQRGLSYIVESPREMLQAIVAVEFRIGIEPSAQLVSLIEQLR